jgi:hypothetical protein
MGLDGCERRARAHPSLLLPPFSQHSRSQTQSPPPLFNPPLTISVSVSHLPATTTQTPISSYTAASSSHPTSIQTPVTSLNTSSFPALPEDSGVGKPPAMKRPRGGLGRTAALAAATAAAASSSGRPADEMGRNATGRNFSFGTNGSGAAGKGKGPASYGTPAAGGAGVTSGGGSSATPAGQMMEEEGDGDGAMTGVRRSSRLSSAQTGAGVSSRPARFLPTRNKARPPLPPPLSAEVQSQQNANATPSLLPSSKLYQPNLPLSASVSTHSFAESKDDMAMSPPPSFQPKPPPFPSQSTLSSFPTSSSLASSLGIGTPPVQPSFRHQHQQPSSNIARSIFPQPPQVVPLQASSSQPAYPSSSYTANSSYTPAEHYAVDSWILSILRIWGRATRHMAQYEMKLAVEEFDRLPREVTRGNPRICALVGKCWYEMVDYVKVALLGLHIRFSPYEINPH